ncbi:hypothetical protein [Longitalea luteola]|uniref:hypothetical protein n=1 Tax=Longitalea luteola TaxID=2812563 RepID=UPI001A970E59|nr:hypothetical protein [Longitalea luteola]
MKRLILSMAVLAVAAGACKKNGADKGFEPRSTFAGPYADTITLPLTITTDTELDPGILWVLDGKTYVTNGATLIVPEGTRVEAKKKSTNDSASALIITRGSQLFAVGNAQNPVVFTSHEANPASGDWGGIVLLGNAPLNRADATIEGINLPSVPAGVDINYGGGAAGQGDVNHKAGELQYVRIEYAGAAIATDNELNGLTCGGVGAGTVLDHIEVAYGNDDAFEFFGGTVNAKYLFALAPDDDAFDFDFGYRGHIQYAVSVLDPNETYSANPNGIESDNNGTGAADQPFTNPYISNMTVIGWSNAISGTLSAAHFRRHSLYDVRNSIFIGFPRGIRLESTPTINHASHFSHNIVHAFNASQVLDPVTAPFGAGIFTSTASNSNADVVLNNPFNLSSPDFRIVAGSNAATLGTDFTGLDGYPGFFTATSYRGAFDVVAAGNTNNWLAGWAKYDY